MILSPIVNTIVILGSVITATPVLAHCGNAAYADTITEFKSATITKFAWANPHALIDFDAVDAKGNPVHMVFRMGLRPITS